jgi:hypothetical protein
MAPARAPIETSVTPMRSVRAVIGVAATMDDRRSLDMSQLSIPGAQYASVPTGQSRYG